MKAECFLMQRSKIYCCYDLKRFISDSQKCWEIFYSIWGLRVLKQFICLIYTMIYITNASKMHNLDGQVLISKFSSFSIFRYFFLKRKHLLSINEGLSIDPIPLGRCSLNDDITQYYRTLGWPVITRPNR